MEGVTPEMMAAREKMRARIGDISRVGGARVNRKRPVPQKPSAGGSACGEDKRLTAAVRKLGLTTLPGMDEAAMFKSEGNDALFFSNPRVQAMLNANTFVISGPSETKPADSISVPVSIDQETLKKIAAQMRKLQQGKLSEDVKKVDDDEEIPDLVATDEPAADSVAA